MVKIIEIKETIFDSQLVDNIYAIDKTVKEIMNETNFITELNRDDYNYINIILEKTRINLEKAFELLKKKQQGSFPYSTCTDRGGSDEVVCYRTGI